MKKALLLLLAALLVLTAMPTAFAEEITLTWAVFETNNFTAEYYQHIIDTYEADNPGIKIEKVLMTGDSRPQFLKTQLSAGNMPDINIDPVDLANIEGVYAEVPEWLLEQFDSSAVVQNNGKTVLIPAYTGMRSQVFYNKEQFAAAGIEAIPTTPEEFTAVCEKLSEAGYTPLITAGPKDIWATDFGFWVGQVNSDLMEAYPNFNEDLIKGNVKWENETLSKGIKYWRTLIDAGYYHKGSMSFSYNQASEEFMKGNAAMMMDGAWVATTIDGGDNEYAKENIGCFVMPNFSGVKTYCTMPQYWAVAEACEHKEEAFKFCAYVLGGNPDIYRHYLKADGVFSITKEPVTYELGKLQGEYMANFEGYTLVPEITKLQGDYALPVGFEDMIHKFLQQVFIGDDIDEQLPQWDAEFQKLLEG